MQFEHITCPHCGLLCDDLTVEVDAMKVTTLNANHPKCQAGFADASIAGDAIPDCLNQGKTIAYREALNQAAELLRNAKLPLISGLVADVQACREALALTEKTHGVIDHANGRGIRSSTAVMQRIGEVKATLAEVRNRADCVVIFGAAVLEKFPRLVDRILTPEKTLGTDNTTSKSIYIIDLVKNKKPNLEHDNITYLAIDEDSLENITHKLQALVKSADNPNKDKTEKALQPIYEKICSSNYTTLIWTGSEFNSASAEHTIQILTQIIKHLAIEHRVVGLPLSGSKGEVSASQVTTWQTGVPLPVAFINGIPTHDPVRFDGVSMLENQEADVLLWIATYNSKDLPPKTDIPTILIGHPNMQCDYADVFIPAGVPGIDHKGLVCRTDSVATLPLQIMRDSGLRAASDILNNLTQLI